MLLPYSKHTLHFFDTYDITLCVKMLHMRSLCRFCIILKYVLGQKF